MFRFHFLVSKILWNGPYIKYSNIKPYSNWAFLWVPKGLTICLLMGVVVVVEFFFWGGGGGGLLLEDFGEKTCSFPKWEKIMLPKLYIIHWSLFDWKKLSAFFINVRKKILYWWNLSNWNCTEHYYVTEVKWQISNWSSVGYLKHDCAILQ